MSLKISVVTPNFNYSEYINYTINSVITQDYKFIEHIIVDDGSTDDSVQIVSNLVRLYPDKIKLIKQKNSGQTVAINVGLKNISGDIVGWINSDDTYCDNVFNKIVDFFHNNPGIDLIFSDVNIIDNNGVLISEKKYLDFDFESACILNFGNVMANNTVFLRRSLLEKVGYLNESLKYNMDVEFWFRISQFAKIKKVSFTIGNYRNHIKTKTNTHRDELLAEFQPLLKKFYFHTRASKIIPFKYYILVKFFYLTKRVFFKFFNGHYFTK